MLQDLRPSLSGHDTIHSDSFILQKQVVATILKITPDFMQYTGILLPCSKESDSENYLVLDESNENIHRIKNLFENPYVYSQVFQLDLCLKYQQIHDSYPGNAC